MNKQINTVGEMRAALAKLDDKLPLRIVHEGRVKIIETMGCLISDSGPEKVYLLASGYGMGLQEVLDNLLEKETL